MRPLISIVIPVYNTEKYLRKCLNSVLAQSYDHWEIIAVDDCSTDKSRDILREYGATDSRIRFYENGMNQGCGLTRRRCIGLCKGDYFAFIDSDDYVDKDFLKDMLEACLNHQAEIAVCGTYNRDKDYKYQSQDIAECEYEVRGEQLYREYMNSSYILQYNGNKLYNRRVIDAVEYSGLRYCEDSMTTYKWLWQANKAVVMPRSYYHYVHHDDSNSRDNNSALQKDIDTVRCVYDHWCFCIENGFNDMLENLCKFTRKSLVNCIYALQIDSEEYREIDRIRKEFSKLKCFVE